MTGSTVPVRDPLAKSDGCADGEVPTRDTFVARCFRRERPAGQRIQPVRKRSAAANNCSRTSCLATHYSERMPTVPPKHSPPVDNEPHRARQMAEPFGVDAERYDRGRPRYPDALVQRIVAASPGREVLDVGCGTGIAARQFQALGCTVLGVDPDPRMAEFARQSGVEIELATFETWDPAGRLFDAVVAGQAYHYP
jgi:Methyltransferase domain